MKTAKLKSAAMVVILVFVAVILWQEQRANRLMVELASLRKETAEQAAAEQKETLPTPQDQAGQPMTQDQFRELLRLRGQVTTLRAQLAQATNVALKAVSTAIERETQEIASRAVFAKEWMFAFKAFATENQGQCPTNFDQTAPFLRDQAKAQTNGATDEFEIVYRGSLDDLTNSGDIIVIRERGVRHRYDGKWGRVYGLGDGASQYRFLDTQSALEQWEQERLQKTTTP